MIKLLFAFGFVLTGLLFLSGNGKDSGYNCIITYDYVDTASAYSKNGNYSVGTFSIKRKHFGDSTFIEEIHSSDLLLKKQENNTIYGLDTFKVIDTEWHQIYMGKSQVVYSRDRFVRKKPTTLYYSWVIENNKVALVNEEIRMNNDTIRDSPPEMFYYVLKPADTVRLNGELCYEYTKYDGKNEHQPLGTVYFNYDRGVVRFKSAGDPYPIFDMVNYKKGLACK